MQRYHVYEIPKGGHVPRHVSEHHTIKSARNAANALGTRTDIHVQRIEVRGLENRLVHTVYPT